MPEGLRPGARAGKSGPDACTWNQESPVLGIPPVQLRAQDIGVPQPESGRGGTWLGCPVGPAHPLVRGRLTQGVYHLSDLGRRGGPRVVGSRRPERSILPPPGNAGSGCQGNRRLAPAVPPTHLPFVPPVASWLRISLSAPQDVQK